MQLTYRGASYRKSCLINFVETVDPSESSAIGMFRGAHYVIPKAAETASLSSRQQLTYRGVRYLH